MKLSSQDLEELADRTLQHYNQNADDFWDGTHDHDVNQNGTALSTTVPKTSKRQALICIRAAP